MVIDFDVGLRNLDLVMGCERRRVRLHHATNGDADQSGADHDA
jgi:septum formation inhibitor-activating ATPase MinD